MTALVPQQALLQLPARHLVSHHPGATFGLGLGGTFLGRSNGTSHPAYAAPTRQSGPRTPSSMPNGGY